jgi:hypothetical protein
MSAYQEIAGPYSYARLRVGMVIRCGSIERYIQPGDDTATMMETIESLEEIPETTRATIADMALGDYFSD